MPSASAKLEKQSSTDSCDPVKQVSTLLDNKIRNLEKRKGKLDGYREDSNSGKELNADQLNAVKKYDQVLEVLEFARDLQKNLKTIITDCQKHQKKAAKREVAEKQSEQQGKLREVLLFQDLLNNMGTEQARQDFLEQTNGAVKLSKEELDKLDELYKLVSPERASGEEGSPSFEDQLSAAAEHLLHLLDARPKEVLATTYKSLKDVLLKIHASGYFDADSKAETVQQEAPVTEEEVPQPEQEVAAAAVAVVASPVPTARAEETFQGEEVQAADDISATAHHPMQVDRAAYFGSNGTPSNYVAPGVQTQQPPQQQQGPLTDVLHGQAPINFLQDSQVDLESPLMDPAVVVAHPMAPPPPLGYHSVPFMGSPSVPANPQAQTIYEPIPTQTFTNQNFAAKLPNVVVPPASPYMAVNAGGSSGGNMNQMRLLPSAASMVVQQQQQTEPQAPEPQQIAPEPCIPKQQGFEKLSSTDYQANLTSGDLEHQRPPLYQTLDDNEENCDGFQTQLSNNNSRQGGYPRGGVNRGGPRGGPRPGSNNGYNTGGRPRGPYNHENDNTTGRGGYQGNNYNRDYNSRRGAPNQRGTGGRGGPRGGPHQQGASRGGNSYRSQPQMQQQQ